MRYVVVLFVRDILYYVFANLEEESFCIVTLTQTRNTLTNRLQTNMLFGWKANFFGPQDKKRQSQGLVSSIFQIVHYLVHTNFDLVRSLLARKVAQFKCFFVYFRSKISSPTLVLFVVLGGATIHPFDYLALKHLPRQLSRHPSNYIAGKTG